MNQKEQEIISHLRKDARISLASVSHELGMPISTIYDKINRLNNNNTIKKFTALVNFKKLGYHHHAKVALKVQKYQKDDLLIYLRNHYAINSLHEINHCFDFLIEVVHRDVKEFISFVEDLKDIFDILDLKEFQIINEVKREEFMS